VPAAVNEAVVDDFTTVTPGVCVALIVKLVVGDVVVPVLAEAVLVTLPASTSACVVVYEPVQVIEAPGTRPPDGSAGHDTEAILLSDTVTADVKVVLPEFVTLYE